MREAEGRQGTSVLRVLPLHCARDPPPVCLVKSSALSHSWVRLVARENMSREKKESNFLALFLGTCNGFLKYMHAVVLIHAPMVVLLPSHGVENHILMYGHTA